MSLKKNADGTWSTDFRAGKLRFREKFLTREDARQFEQQTKITLKLGVSIQPTTKGKTLVEGISEYYKIESAKKESKKDEKAFLMGLYYFLNEMLELEHIGEVKLIHLSEYQTHLLELNSRELLHSRLVARFEKKKARGEVVPKLRPPTRPLSASGVNRHFNTIRDFFSYARKWGWIESSPCAELESLPESPVARKPWSDADIQTALNLLDPWAKRPAFLIAKTGMRPVETKRLTWADVDLKNKIFTAKTKKGDGSLRERKIPMTYDVEAFFEMLKLEAKKKPIIGQNAQYVFHSATFLRLDTKALAREMARVTKVMGIEGFSLYGFRHSFVTTMANPSEDGSRGGNLEAARILAGHTSISQTQDYNHTSDKIVREELDKVSKFRNIKFSGGE